MLEETVRISSQEVQVPVQDQHLELVQGLGSEINQITINIKVRTCVCMYLCMYICVYVRIKSIAPVAVVAFLSLNFT